MNSPVTSISADRWRLYEVTVTRSRYDVGSSLVSAPSPSEAMVEAWRDYKEMWSITFRNFLAVAKVRAWDGPPPDTVYDYFHKCYGLLIRVGDRVILQNEGELSGREGEVIYPCGFGDYIHVVLDGKRRRSLVHPRSVVVLPKTREARA